MLYFFLGVLSDGKLELGPSPTRVCLPLRCWVMESPWLDVAGWLEGGYQVCNGRPLARCGRAAI